MPGIGKPSANCAPRSGVWQGLPIHKSGGDGKGAAIWDTKTYGNPGAYAVMQEDGNVVVYGKDGGQGKGGAIWHSDTWR
ncbi:hypothetical protein [Streptomyces sp. NPDC049949]|uniref:hypothetical protein n=1 Tax=Streptomyces sp. NPDC049949 TaxID=3154627 RepID=UPI00344080AC